MVMTEEAALDRKSAFETSMWEQRARGSAAGGYEKLGWVGNDGLLQPFVELAATSGNEMAVDVGTGSLAVLRKMAPYVKYVFGFDISSGMINRGVEEMPKNSSVFVADGYKIPLEDGIVDITTTRMVYHHLPDVGLAVGEANRILRPGGKLIVSEYVAPDLDTLVYDNQAFQMKEPGRHLWTGEQLQQLIAQNWATRNGNVELHYAMLPQYSVKDWMGKSGLSVERQTKVLQHYLDAPEEVVKSMGISYVGEGNSRDALVNRLFAFVVATK